MISFGIATDMIKNAKQIVTNDALRFALNQDEVKELIIELNTDVQMFEDGIDSKGVDFRDIYGSGYAESTIRDKKLSGLPFTHITLFDSGDFYKTFKVKVNANDFEIIANTLKEGQDLQDRFGSNIVGLTDDSINILIDDLTPLLRGFIINVLFKR